MKSTCRTALLFVAAIVVVQAQDTRYDLILRNARVIDGTGNP
jgi:hypothetical protein